MKDLHANVSLSFLAVGMTRFELVNFGPQELFILGSKFNLFSYSLNFQTYFEKDI